MRYAPSQGELNSFQTMSKQDRLIYCLTRIVEAEEVWGLAEDQGWVMSETKGQSTLPIWPYKIFATISQKGKWQYTEPQAISLEHFLYKVSQQLIDNHIMIELAPTTDAEGYCVEAKAFFSALENLMESGEYFMEG